MDTFTAGMRWTPSQQGQEMETFTTRIGDGHLHSREEMDTFTTGTRNCFHHFFPKLKLTRPSTTKVVSEQNTVHVTKNLKLLAFLKSININTRKVKKNAYFNGTSCENKRSFNILRLCVNHAYSTYSPFQARVA